MAVLPVRLFPDPVLRSRAEEVTDFTEDFTHLIHDMIDTMYADGGVGLAAPQVGISRRIFVFDCGDGIEGHVFNPVWEPLSEDKQTGSEGCLSVPGIYGDVERYDHVVVRGKNMDGEDVEYEGEGLFARCIQHETDHLNGRVFVLAMEPQARKQAMSEIRNASWFGQTQIMPGDPIA